MNHTIQLHIVLSTLAFIVLIFAASLAVLLALQDRALRRQRAAPFLSWLPLEHTEILLFKAIALGFVLLTIDVVASLWVFRNELTPLLWHKIFLAIFACVVFLILLIGRRYSGWRGRVAIRWTLIGVLLVILAYIGSLVW
jgi:ABC-type uncharacterized transport system permease subunit